MKKVINFNSNEILVEKSLSAIKGGSNSSGIINSIISIINGGDETDKRPKKPTMSTAQFGKNTHN